MIKNELMQIAQHELSKFINSLNLMILNRTAPVQLLERPTLIGQCLHEIAGGCVVYMLICKEHGSEVSYIKIGLARNIEKRVCGIASACPLEIKKALYFCLPGYQQAYHLEQSMHAAFSDHRVRGEWFGFPDRNEREVIVRKMLEYVEGELEEHFNSFIYTPALANDPDVQIARAFAQKVWYLSTDASSKYEIERVLASLSPSSSENYERLQSVLQQSKIC